MKTKNIFFSWQSDLPTEKTTSHIEHVIKEIIAELELKNKEKIIFDESTRDIPGSPDIADTIFSKILASDIFIADISIINSNDNENRKTPNPNVLIELGYALSVLGSKRILLLFNTDYGNKNDIPFDISKNRILNFKINDENDKSGIKNLKNNLLKNIELIIKNNPVKQILNPQLNKEKEERIRDVDNINKIMSTIHLDTVDFFIEQLPDRVSEKIFSFWEYFCPNYQSSTFYLYDKELWELFEKFKTLWSKSLSFWSYYRDIPGREYYKFNIKGDIFTTKDQKDAYDRLSELKIDLFKVFNELVTNIRENYIEVDLDERSKIALETYQQIMKESTEKFEEINRKYETDK